MKQHIKIKWWMGCALGMLFILGACSSDSSTGGVGDGSDGMLTDSRDGQTYKTVTIGTQTWMAENLNYAVDSSWCYNNSADSCAKYGRLYQWAAAMALPAAYNEAAWGGSDVNHQGVCPAGWHIPTDAEWTILTNAVGGEDVAGMALRSTSGWNEGGNGTDVYGFSALPAGSRYSGNFDDVGSDGIFWGTMEIGADDAHGRIFTYNEYEGMGYGGLSSFKGEAFSVRCLKN